MRTFGVRPVRIASRRLADENPPFGGMRNLMRCVPRSLMYSSRPKARTAHIASARLADENPLLADTEPDAPRCTGPRVRQYTSALCALRIRTRFMLMQNLACCSLERPE